MVTYFAVGVGLTLGMIFVRVVTGMEGEPSSSSSSPSHADGKVVSAALLPLGSLCAGWPVGTQAAVNAGAAPALVALLAHPRSGDGVRRAAALQHSNLAAGTAGQVQAMVDAGALPPLASLLGTGAPTALRAEAAHALSHVAGRARTRAQLAALKASGVAPKLAVLLEQPPPRSDIDGGGNGGGDGGGGRVPEEVQLLPHAGVVGVVGGLERRAVCLGPARLGHAHGPASEAGKEGIAQGPVLLEERHNRLD